MSDIKQPGKAIAQEGAIRFSGVYFLAALVLLIATAPVVETLERGVMIEAVLITLVLILAVFAIGGRRNTLVWAIMLSIPALVGKWLNIWWPHLWPSELFLSAGLLFIGYVVLHLFHFILRAPRVNLEVLCAAVANYLMLGLFWALAYSLVAAIAPQAFSFNATGPEMKGSNSLYFSFSTLCTVGYGDIVPVSGGARMLAMSEAIVGMFYMTVLIARLVSLYSSEARPDDAGT